MQDPLTSVSQLLLATVLAGSIGLDREKKHHPAGLRTHIFVCLTSTFLMIAAGEYPPDAAARFAQAIMTGVGFLGAGTIIGHGLKIHGLTTAASVWAVAGLDILVGMGQYLLAVLSTFLFLLLLKFRPLATLPKRT